MFKQKLYEANEAYKIFLDKMRSLYNHFFPRKKIVISKKA